MLEIFSYEFVWLAVLCSLIVGGILAYLGFHIVSRGVIFVDLALAQMAAVGAVFAPMIGIPEHSPLRYVVSLAFTFLGAWIVSVSRVRDNRIPQEAFIGILYAAAAALTILLLSQQAGGMEELQHLLAGSMLTVSPGEILTMAIVYAAVGAVHYRFRDRFFQITQDRAAAIAKGWKTTGWDFLFYSSLAIVVTSTVTVVGVLLIFSFLVIPPVVALFFARGVAARVAIGWTAAVLASIVGVGVSIALDLPAGPSVIAVLAAILVASSLIYKLGKVGR